MHTFAALKLHLCLGECGYRWDLVKLSMKTLFQVSQSSTLESEVVTPLNSYNREKESVVTIKSHVLPQ